MKSGKIQTPDRILSGRYRSIVQFCLIVFLVCVVSVLPAFADRPASGNGQAIKDAVSEVLSKTDTLVINLGNLCDVNCQATDAGKAFTRKVDRVKAAQTRANNAHDRTTAVDYEKVNRRESKRKSQDGCDPDIQVCVDSQTVAATSNSSDPILEIDENRGKDIIEDLNEISSDVNELNTVLAGNAPPPPPTVYQELENAEYFFPENMWPSTTTLYLSFIASQVAGKAAVVADKVCDQTLVALGAGGNGSMGCIVTWTISEIVKMAYESMEFIDQDKSSSEITGTYKRIGNVYEQLLGTGGDINAVKEVVEAMGMKMLELEKNQHYIIQMLETPQGQRSGFPSK